MKDYLGSPKGICMLVAGVILGACIGRALLHETGDPVQKQIPKDEAIIHTIGAAMAVDLKELKKGDDTVGVGAEYDLDQINWPRIQHNIRRGTEEAAFLDSGDRRELVRRLDDALAADERNRDHKSLEEWCDRVLKMYLEVYKKAFNHRVEEARKKAPHTS
jgi:hypothetical protein